MLKRRKLCHYIVKFRLQHYSTGRNLLSAVLFRLFESDYKIQLKLQISNEVDYIPHMELQAISFKGNIYSASLHECVRAVHYADW